MLHLPRITLVKVTSKHTGLYVCDADNGVGRPAVGAVYVRVLRTGFTLRTTVIVCSLLLICITKDTCQKYLQKMLEKIFLIIQRMCMMMLLIAYVIRILFDNLYCFF